MVLDQPSFLQIVFKLAYQTSQVALVFSVGLKASEWLQARPTSLSATGKGWLQYRPEARSEGKHLVVAALLQGVREDQAMEVVLELVAVKFEVQLHKEEALILARLDSLFTKHQAAGSTEAQMQLLELGPSLPVQQ